MATGFKELVLVPALKEQGLSVREAGPSSLPSLIPSGQHRNGGAHIGVDLHKLFVVVETM